MRKQQVKMILSMLKQ